MDPGDKPRDDRVGVVRRESCIAVGARMTEAEHVRANAAPAAVRRLMDYWHTTECYVAVAAFTLIAGLLLADVLGREFIGPILHKLNLYNGPTGIFGSQRVSVYALIVGSFAGIGIATATNSRSGRSVAAGSSRSRVTAARF